MSAIAGIAAKALPLPLTDPDWRYRKYITFKEAPYFMLGISHKSLRSKISPEIKSKIQIQRKYLKFAIESGELNTVPARPHGEFPKDSDKIKIIDLVKWIKKEQSRKNGMSVCLEVDEYILKAIEERGREYDNSSKMDFFDIKDLFKKYALLLEKVTGERVGLIDHWIAHEVLARLCDICTIKSNKDKGCAVHNEGAEKESTAYSTIERELKKCGFKSKSGRLTKSDKDKHKKKASEIVQKISQESSNSDAEVIKSLKKYFCV